MMPQYDVIVIGSGLSGLSAAWAFCKAGKKPLVLEAEGHIGGRTASWDMDGMPVESGLHKYLGIYRALPRLLREVGVEPDDILTWVDALELHRAGSPPGFFPVAPYRRPLRTAAGLVGNNAYLPLGDKLRLVPFGMRGLFDCVARAGRLDLRDIDGYARSSGAGTAAIRTMLHTLTAGVFFLPSNAYSAYATFAPVLEGLKRGMTFGIGAFNGGMTDVMMRPIADAIERKGGAVRAKAPVKRLVVLHDAVTGVETAEERIEARGVVVATGLRPAQRLLEDAFPRHPAFRPMHALSTLSAVTLQCELREPLWATDHTHMSDTGVSCFAEQSHTTFRHAPGRLSAILYPPDSLRALSDAEIFEYASKEMERIGVRFAPLVTRYRTVRHEEDFYAMRPGAEALRPAQGTPVRGLALAGDYTKQPFLASMEGAVISGELAARAILRA